MKIEFSENFKKWLFFLIILFLSFIIGEIYFYVDAGRYFLSYEFGFITVILFIRSLFIGFLIIIDLAIIIGLFNYLKDNLTIKWGKE